MIGDPIQFDFLISLFTPLITTEQAGFLLDGASEDHVIRLLEEGALRAISIHVDGSERRALRIYRYTVEHLVMARRSPVERVPVTHILQHMRPTLLVREVASLLSCTEQHVRNLRFDGPRFGSRGCMPRVYREALTGWIEEREIK